MRQVLPPESWLLEVQLADRYGIPTSKVREALVSLERLGLVERVPNRGAFVVRHDTGQVSDIYLIREVDSPNSSAMRLSTSRPNRLLLVQCAHCAQ